MSIYLQRQALYPPFIEQTNNASLELCIVIPCRGEKDLNATLESLLIASEAIDSSIFEVLVVVNHPENEKEDLKKENERLFIEYRNWIEEHPEISVHLIRAFDLPKKKGGVGLARKIGMDEAVRRLEHNEDGIILALDADCVVSSNYLKEVYSFFKKEKEVNGASLYYEHPLDGENSMAIAQYELHLRYYNCLLRYAGHPFAFHTVGSSMAVRRKTYEAVGGMNTRKAGEDFYFLQKVIQQGNFAEINSLKVIPSARFSDRVPFGTGRAMLEWKEELTTYHPDAGMALRNIFKVARNNAEGTLSYAKELLDFISEEEWTEKWKEIHANTKSSEQAMKRFFQWFNLFMCFKFVHFYRDNIKENIAVYKASNILLERMKLEKATDLSSMMNIFREGERSGRFRMLFKEELDQIR